jgi:hypothetical protein
MDSLVGSVRVVEFSGLAGQVLLLVDFAKAIGGIVNGTLANIIILEEVAFFVLKECMVANIGPVASKVMLRLLSLVYALMAGKGGGC